jgi:hypothetical protein
VKVLTFAIALGFAGIAFAQENPPARGYEKVKTAYSATPQKTVAKTARDEERVVFTSKAGAKTPTYIYKAPLATRPLKTW